MFTYTGVSHFTKLKHDMVRMMPAIFPKPLLLVYITGVLELLGALGILLPATRALAGICLILFLLAVFPANMKAAREKIMLDKQPTPPLGWLLPTPAFFIGCICWA